MSRASYLDVTQGASEARTEAYLSYVEGALQLATQCGARSWSGVGGFADKQAVALRSST